MTFGGTFGLFLTAMFLFVRILPMISIFELRTLLPESHAHEAPEVKQ
jgi:molybdopterin-containing oxidoreductase family membrane subunit